MIKAESETEIEIQFYDLDPMNVVWHGNYIKYFEIARCELLKKIGYEYNDMKRDNIMYPVAKLDVKYIKPCFFKQKIIVKAEIAEVEPCLILKYTIFDAITKTIILKGSTMQICVETKTGNTLYELPENFAKKLANYQTENVLNNSPS